MTEAVDRGGRGEIEGETAAGVPMEVAIGVGLDKEVDVGAVSVPPTGGERGAAPQAEVLLTAEDPAEGSTDRLQELVGTAGQPEISHGRGGTWYRADESALASSLAA